MLSLRCSRESISLVENLWKSLHLRLKKTASWSWNWNQCIKDFNLEEISAFNRPCRNSGVLRLLRLQMSDLLRFLFTLKWNTTSSDAARDSSHTSDDGWGRTVTKWRRMRCPYEILIFMCFWIFYFNNENSVATFSWSEIFKSILQFGSCRVLFAALHLFSLQLAYTTKNKVVPS